jgi:phage shock protein A
MNGIKRLFLSITAQANRIVDDFENHEAVAEVAIQEFATLYASTAAHARQQATELQNLDRRIEAMTTEEKLWARRAVEAQAQDRARALECVRRLQATRLVLAQETQHRTEAAAILADINRRRDEMRAQLETLKQRRQHLSVRQCQAEAQQRYASVDPTRAQQTSIGVFDRWESRITAAEALTSVVTETDSFAHEFACAEEEQTLQATLDALVAQARKDQPNS